MKKAQKIYSTFTQEQVDEIFRAAALAANNARIPLAKMAVEETRMGIVKIKLIKNHFASEYIYNKYKNTKTCGIIEEDIAKWYQKGCRTYWYFCWCYSNDQPNFNCYF